MKTEQWKDEVMNSLQGAKRAEPGPFLFTRIEARLQKNYGRATVWQVRFVAAALTVLLIINTLAIMRSYRSEGNNLSNPYRLSNIQNY